MASLPLQSKIFDSAKAALADLSDGAILGISGFAGHGVPETLLRRLLDSGVKDLTCICHGAWPIDPDQPRRTNIAHLVESGQIKKIVSPLPFNPRDGGIVKTRWESGQLEIEVVPAGILAERLRSGGAGIGGVFLPTGAGTRFAEGQEVRQIGGREHVFQPALKLDYALLRAQAADTLGNLVYTGTQRNWGPVIAMAATVTVVEVGEVHEPGGLDPERVITPGIFVNRIVQSI